MSAALASPNSAAPTMNLYQRIRVWNRARRYRRKSEPDECRFTCDCLEPGQTVLDIGAHKAAFTYWMSQRVGPRGKVYAFEPQPQLAAYLQSFADTCRHQNVQVCPVALSDRTRQGELLVPHAHLGWATLEFTAAAADQTVLKVPVERLDDYLARLAARRPISFIKCDVELHELAVLRGGTQLLQQDRPILLVESLPLAKVQDNGCATFTLLKSLGFHGYFFYQTELVPLQHYHRATYPGTNDQVQNYVFVHADAVTLTGLRPPYALQRASSNGRARERAA